MRKEGGNGELAMINSSVLRLRRTHIGIELMYRLKNQGKLAILS